MMHSNSQLLELIEATARTDRVSFAKLYELTAPHLFALALRILKRQDWAEEALQDCFLKIWRKADDFDPERGRAFTWLATIVRNQCIDQMRKSGREPVSPEEFKEEWQASDLPSTLELVQGSQSAKALRDCMEELSEEERRTLVLAYWKGLTHSELAQNLERPLGTVKTWVRRGLERLKGCLER